MGFRKPSGAVFIPVQRVEREEQSTASAADAIVSAAGGLGRAAARPRRSAAALPQPSHGPTAARPRPSPAHARPQRRMNEQGDKPDADAPYPQPRAPDAPGDIRLPPKPHESGAYLMRDTRQCHPTPISSSGGGCGPPSAGDMTRGERGGKSGEGGVELAASSWRRSGAGHAPRPARCVTSACEVVIRGFQPG
jgi:hypothetical protein